VGSDKCALFSMASTTSDIELFLQPLYIDIPKVHSLARAFASTFAYLALESLDQFLSTPISDSVLRPEGDEKGRSVETCSSLSFVWVF